MLPPVPASRPRVTRYGTYYSETYKKWKTEALKSFPPIVEALQGPLEVSLLVVCKRPKKLTMDIPPGDVDNFAKAALDAINDGKLWGDDKQVVQLIVSKRYAEHNETPRTEVTIRVLNNLHGDTH